jgi:hypothetical protein
LVEPQAQADPKFQTPFAFTRITARAVHDAFSGRARVEGFCTLPSDGGRTAQPHRLPAPPGSQGPARKKLGRQS